MTQAQAPVAPATPVVLPEETAAPRGVLVRALVAMAAPVLAEHALHIIVGHARAAHCTADALSATLFGRGAESPMIPPR